MGTSSGAQTSFFVIRRVQIHEGLCPVMCCVRVCRFLSLLRFRFCDVYDTCIARDVQRLCGVMCFDVIVSDALCCAVLCCAVLSSDGIVARLRNVM